MPTVPPANSFTLDTREEFPEKKNIKGKMMAGEVFVEPSPVKRVRASVMATPLKKEKKTKKRTTLSVPSYGAIVRSLNFAL